MSFKSRTAKATILLQFLALVIAMLSITACSNEEDVSSITLRVNGTTISTEPSGFVVGDRSDFNGDIDASFTGNGASATRIFSWNNNLRTADYNADITATSDGSFRIIVRDAEETIVLDRSIQGGAEPDSIDGVTSAGTSGIWTVTIEVTNFRGDGSFSLSEGD
ncbi:hypothetical protein [Croceivirga thetidis]|uniref:Uncharacterized protein n=1 Tax=Croceivirga thetidis TaxID=2721623 RepID=A0ABX1GUQ4_9FLAO|nr:hypothetical protein [Croceivirga thetidis]NKI32766.1 hypothetical protein [Croceivirga thetidis]